MNSKERFLAACNRKQLDYPPLWIMRQAGRYLPEYRELKKKYDFVTMVKTPELATEVTLQPITRFGFDAAILFSDILVIPEAMGQPYSFRETGGIKMDGSIACAQDVAKLNIEKIEESLSYVPSAIKLVKHELHDTTALIGFSGSPWTLATYMVEGGSSKDHAKVKMLFYKEPKLFAQLLDKITQAVTTYVQMQIDAGVDAIQIFDSWGGTLSEHNYWEASGNYIATIIQKINRQVPVILFAKGCHHWPHILQKMNADILGLDWSVSIAKFYDMFDGKVAVQGNLDPSLMNTEPEIVAKEAQRILEEFGRRPGHIFNLGHGILPQAKIECVEALISTIRQ